jgi:hypothetical protein
MATFAITEGDTMTLVSGQVRVAGTGELFLAPVGTALPTSAAAALNASFSGYGYTTDDGVTLSKSVDRDGVDAWQSATPVRNIITGQEFTVECTFLQSNSDILKLWLGSGDFATDGGTGYRADVPIDPVGQQFAMVLEWADGTIVSRLVMAKVEVTETGEVTLARQAQSYPVTFGALPPDGGSVLASWLTTDAAFA